MEKLEKKWKKKSKNKMRSITTARTWADSLHFTRSSWPGPNGGTPKIAGWLISCKILWKILWKSYESMDKFGADLGVAPWFWIHFALRQQRDEFMIVAQHFAPHSTATCLFHSFHVFYKFYNYNNFGKSLADFYLEGDWLRKLQKQESTRLTTFGRFCTTLYHYNLFEDSR